jgi:hypothetical protein
MPYAGGTQPGQARVPAFDLAKISRALPGHTLQVGAKRLHQPLKHRE